MKTFGHFCSIFFLLWGLSNTGLGVSPFPDKGVLGPELSGQLDPNVDYEKFSGRVTDKDDSERFFKIKVENNNVKFFRAGDEVYFHVNLKSNRAYCLGHVRSVEDFYFTMHVESLAPCYSLTEYFRRGTVLNFYSKILATRVFEAAQYRQQLIKRKEDFLKQLNGINHFLWTFDQQKVKKALEFDAEINRLEQQKRLALDDMVADKQEKLTLQNELMKKLNQLDESLNFYRVERQELLTDRWNLDHDLGHPVGQRPQELRQE